jgi:hypothetical protein
VNVLGIVPGEDFGDEKSCTFGRKNFISKKRRKECFDYWYLPFEKSRRTFFTE